MTKIIVVSCILPCSDSLCKRRQCMHTRVRKRNYVKHITNTHWRLYNLLFIRVNLAGFLNKWKQIRNCDCLSTVHTNMVKTSAILSEDQLSICVILCSNAPVSFPFKLVTLKSCRWIIASLSLTCDWTRKDDGKATLNVRTSLIDGWARRKKFLFQLTNHFEKWWLMSDFNKMI